MEEKELYLLEKGTKVYYYYDGVLTAVTFHHLSIVNGCVRYVVTHPDGYVQRLNEDDKLYYSESAFRKDEEISKRTVSFGDIYNKLDHVYMNSFGIQKRQWNSWNDVTAIYDGHWHNHPNEHPKCYETKSHYFAHNDYEYWDDDGQYHVRKSLLSTLKPNDKQLELIGRLKELLKELEDNDVVVTYSTEDDELFAVPNFSKVESAYYDDIADGTPSCAITELDEATHLGSCGLCGFESSIVFRGDVY